MIRPPIGVLVKRFPKLSETFILSEILALEALEWKVTIFTLESSSDEIVHPDVARVCADIVPLSTQPVFQLSAELGRRGLAHLHAHFASASAAIARAAAEEAGIGYSVFAHAKDIYLTDPAELRRNLGDARFVATCTSHNAQHLRRTVRGVPVAKLYHGIDADRLPVAARTTPSEPPLILSVARLRRKKGLDTLVDACALLKAKGVRFACEIIGYGPERERLSARIRSADLENDVRLSGKRSPGEVVERMQAATVFALPCRIDRDGDRDGIPNVILEAMVIGLPVISTTVSGIPEVISDGETGWLVPPDDPTALAARLAGAIAAAPERAGIIDNARHVVRNRFATGEGYAMLDRLLRGAVGQTPPAIGYVLKGFPRLSESFVSAEVRRLERLGKRLTVFATMPGDELAEPVLAEINSPIAYLPNAGSVRKSSLPAWLALVLPAYIPIHWRLFRRRPRAWLAVLGQAIQFSRRYRHPEGRRTKRSYFKQFVQAGAIAEALPRAGIGHLHGHFCHNAATITWFAARLAGCSFSFTAHAKDIYQPRHNPGDLLRRKIEAAAFVATCTGCNRRHLSEQAGEAGKLHLVYHGLDTGHFRPIRRRGGGSQPKLIAVGRHVEKKGFLNLVAALDALRERGVVLECRIIGEEGPARAKLLAEIEARRLSDQIKLDPPQPHAMLRRSYAAAEIFVLPCRIDDSGDRDGIPNVLAEAMAMELAVVSTHVSGIPELVSDGENGLLVAPDDWAALAGAIERLAGDAGLRARLGKAAAATIRERFDGDRTILVMDRLLDQALSVAA